ncbi:MAG: hypothetical protein WC004_01355 [Candidatus Absconditabacterales bacterium]
MNKNLALGAIVLSLAAAACSDPQIETVGTKRNSQEYKSATTRQLHFELQGNVLTAPHYPYMSQIQEQVRAVMTQQGRQACDVNVIETLDPRSLNSNGELILETDTFARINATIAGYVPQQ